MRCPQCSKRAHSSPEVDCLPCSCRSVNVTQDGIISFVLPVKGSPEELGFVRNQLHSFDKFLSFEGLREMLILCPSEDLPHVTTYLQTVQRSLPRLQHLPLRVVPEGLCAPELLPGSVYTPHFVRWPGEHVLHVPAVDLSEISSTLSFEQRIFHHLLGLSQAPDGLAEDC